MSTGQHTPCLNCYEALAALVVLVARLTAKTAKTAKICRQEMLTANRALLSALQLNAPAEVHQGVPQV